MKNYIKGEIYYAYLNPVIGSEQDGLRPVLIIQDNRTLINANTVLIAPLTKTLNKKYYLPSHVYLKKCNGLNYDSVILIEHIRAIDKCRIKGYITKISPKKQLEVNKAIINTFNLNLRRNKYEK